MTILSDGQWRLIENAYRTTGEPLAAMAERFGISPSTIHNRRAKFGWLPRRAGAIKASADATAEGLSDHEALIARFRRLILSLIHI